ncbi:MAG: competence/damage-inducible protein A [Oscillospiraceae bacterium]|nr:competence/damage-inducible protein A [Oscillospiraceae bacterium]
MSCAELLCVGTELLLGNIVNTDAQFLSQKLSELGINVFFQTVVGDNPARLESAVKIAASRADIIITTGGLGPTSDDLTKETVAACFGKKLVYHEEEAEKIRNMFSGRHKLTENNFRQAMLPEGCTVLENTCGTAPGCAFEADGKFVIMLPGPPRECKAMFEKAAWPLLEKRSGGCLVSRMVHIFGFGESAVEDALHDLIANSVNPTVAPYAGSGEAKLRVTARAETHDEAYAMTEPVIEKIKQGLPDCIYGIDCQSLEAEAVRLLKEKKLTLSAAESCTGGLLSKRVTDISGSSEVFFGGAVTYSNEMKERFLGVKHETLEEFGAVSEPVARQMAEGIKSTSGADIGLGITGIAGPGGGSVEKPVGLVYVALASKDGTWCRKLNMGSYGGRDMVRTRSASSALDMVIRYLTGREILPELN